MQDTSQYITADIGLAAFLLLKGCELLSAGREKNRYKFVFKDNVECTKYAVGYINSDYSRFDAILKNLKNLVH